MQKQNFVFDLNVPKSRYDNFWSCAMLKHIHKITSDGKINICADLLKKQTKITNIY